MSIMTPIVIPGRPKGPNPEPTTGRALSKRRFAVVSPVLGSGFFAMRSPGMTKGGA
jgi:hypothetical protein